MQDPQNEKLHEITEINIYDYNRGVQVQRGIEKTGNNCKTLKQANHLLRSKEEKMRWTP